ncbi:MAG: hypothetical protein RSD23_09695 [Ruthenibacterium sp.]
MELPQKTSKKVLDFWKKRGIIDKLPQTRGAKHRAKNGADSEKKTEKSLKKFLTFETGCGIINKLSRRETHGKETEKALGP